MNFTLNWIQEAVRLLKIARAAAPHPPAMPHGNFTLLDEKFFDDVNKMLEPHMPTTGY